MSNEKYFTVIYKGVAPGDEARELGSHPKVVGLALGNLMHERDELEAALAQQPQPSTIPADASAEYVRAWKEVRDIRDRLHTGSPHRSTMNSAIDRLAVFASKLATGDELAAKPAAPGPQASDSDARWCGNGCDCLAQCGDVYAYAKEQATGSGQALTDGFSYAASKQMAVTKEWCRGWDACRAALAAATQAQPEAEAAYHAWAGSVDDEVTLRKAVSVCDDVLTDIADWEDKALAEAVTSVREDLSAMADRIKEDGTPELATPSNGT